MKNKFSTNKEMFLEDSNLEENTKLRYTSVFDSDIITGFEMVLDKDLYDFNKEDLLSVISNTKKVKSRTQKQTLSVIKSYIDWSIEKGESDHEVNPCDFIIDEELRLTDKNKSLYMTLDEFYNYIDTLHISSVDKMLLLLMRYGCNTIEATNLTFKDIDVFNKVINIKDTKTGIDKKYPIDDRFIYAAEECYNCKEYDNILYKDTEYIVKPTRRTRSVKVNDNSLRNRFTMIADKNHIERPNINMMNKSRKFDLLLSIYNQYGNLYNGDVKEVISIFDNNMNENKQYVLKADFEEVFNIKINKFNRKNFTK